MNFWKSTQFSEKISITLKKEIKYTVYEFKSSDISPANYSSV